MLTIESLKRDDLILYECVSGSKAYGLDTKESDTDIRGVFYLPKDMFYGLEYCSQVSNETNDIVYYELGRFIELLLKNNPTVLEMLVTPEKYILYKHDLMKEIQISDFLSALAKDTFVGYAMSQIKKAKGLNKKMFHPMDGERKSLLDFCYVVDSHKSIGIREWLIGTNYRQEYFGLSKINHLKDMYTLFYSDEGEFAYRGICSSGDANEVSLSSIPEGEEPIALLYFNKDAYSIYCKKFREYCDWMKNRNINRYHINKTHGKGYDTKNMMHTIRLLQMALNVFKEQSLSIEVYNREELLNIKNGKFSYEEIVEKAEVLMAAIQNYALQSNMLEVPNKNKIEKLLVDLRLKLYN